jgi:hypothetical protein
MSIASMRAVSASIFTARVTNVNVEDWSVDVITLIGEEPYLDIQVMSPYLHYANGEGLYIMPEVGALCWVCVPSDTIRSPKFVLGFQAPPGSEAGDFSAGRMGMSPGDMMMKTRDENFIILRRGGVIQIGATPLAQRMYIPAGNLLHDICENYKLSSIAGDMQWLVHRTDESTTGDQMTELRLMVRERADDPGHIARITIGSHGESDPTTLQMKVMASGEEDAETKVTLTITKEGDVTWDIARNVATTIRGNETHEVEGDRSVTVLGKNTHETTGDHEIRSTAGNLKMEAALEAFLKATGVTHVDGATVHIGESAQPVALSPLVRGTELKICIEAIIDLIATYSCPASIAAASANASPTGPATPITAGMVVAAGGPLVLGAAAAQGLKALIPPALSNKAFTK